MDMIIMKNRANSAETGEDFTPIDIEQMAHILLLPLFGVLLAIVILFLESIAKELSTHFTNLY